MMYCSVKVDVPPTAGHL